MGCQTALAASWGTAPPRCSIWVLRLHLERGGGGPLGPQAALCSMHPPNPGPGASPPPPQPTTGISLLTTISSARVEGIYPPGWACSRPRRTMAPSITPGANSFHPDLQDGRGGLCSGFIAKCIIFPPLSKIFIYANLVQEPAKFCMGNCPINSAAWKYCAWLQRCSRCLWLQGEAGPPPPSDWSPGAGMGAARCLAGFWRGAGGLCFPHTSFTD